MTTANPSPTIQKVIDTYNEIRPSRKPGTGYTYRQALKRFSIVLFDNDVDPTTSPISELREDMLYWLYSYTNDLARATERLYTDVIIDFYKYVEGMGYSQISLQKLRNIAKRGARRVGARIPSFPKDGIDKLLDYVLTLDTAEYEDETDHLINLRDRALIITLADTGLRIQEALGLNRGDIDYKAMKAIITGKGDKEAVIRFSERSIAAIRDYLKLRTKLLDGKSGKPLASLPLFANHSNNAGKEIKALTTASGRNIAKDRAKEILEVNDAFEIHPHAFRHYFVTKVLNVTGNLKLAQELARHKSVAITQRYTHLTNKELDEGYITVFERSG